MANPELDDTAESLQAKETEHAVPVGVWILFGGLIAWGIYYFFTYVGWDQAEEVKGGGAALGTNITHTVAYTAIPAAVIVLMAFAMSRRPKAKRG